VRLGGIEVTEAHGGAGTARIAANPKSSSFTPLGYRDYELVTPTGTHAAAPAALTSSV
jgi:hypothetical protein